MEIHIILIIAGGILLLIVGSFDYYLNRYRPRSYTDYRGERLEDSGVQIGMVLTEDDSTRPESWREKIKNPEYWVPAGYLLALLLQLTAILIWWIQ